MSRLVKSSIVVIVFLSWSIAVLFAAQEVTLFDASGNAVAYIAEDLTIYLDGGNPVAYVYEQAGSRHIYGFNGKHLGWLEKGIVWDHDGNAVGVTKESVGLLNGFKSFKPFRSFREFAPFKPMFSNIWSSMPLITFLKMGL